VKTAIFYEDVYGVNIHLLWRLNGAQLNAYVGANFPGQSVDSTDDWVGCSFHFEGTQKRKALSHESHLIALRRWDKCPLSYSVLAHEALHVTRAILDPRGFKFSACDEAYCYLLDSIVRRSLERLK
jgi:hypothetical protein